MDQFVDMVAGNYQNLSEKEKEVLRKWKDSDSAQIVSKVLGPELGSLLGSLRDPKPTKSGLGARR